MTIQIIISAVCILHSVASLPPAFSLEPLVYAVLIAYLIGSFPTGYLVGRYCGIDVRQHGSGNIGATNVVRVLGKKWGALVFAIDFLKGGLSVMLAIHWSPSMDVVPGSALGAIAGFMSIVGHSFPIWLGFRGGKGVATTLGVTTALFPVAIPFCLAGWLVVFLITGYVSLASMVAALLLPITILSFHLMTNSVEWPLWIQGDWFLTIVAFFIAGLVLWRHRSNWKRLCEGTEQSFKKKK